ATQVENAAEEEAAKNGHARRGRRGDVADLGVQLEHEARAWKTGDAAERIVETTGPPVLDELELAPERRGRELGGVGEIDTGRREETIVSRVEDDRRTERDRAAAREQIRERQALEAEVEAGRRAEE